MNYDIQCCLDLARLFLSECKGATPADISALSQQIQDAGEDACGMIEFREAQIAKVKELAP